jgi:hypothetical protein
MKNKYKIETEIRKILSTSDRYWWHWTVYVLDDENWKLVGGNSCTAWSRRGAVKEAKRFIRGLETDNHRKVEYYEA